MKNKEKDVEALLERALRSEEAPSPELLNKIKYEFVKEETVLKKETMRRSFGSIAAAVALCVFITTSAFAAWYFLSPSEVAEEFEYMGLAEAFESSDALIINETQSDDGYDISLLGIVSGKGLDGFAEEIDISKTYAVMAIAKQNGIMPDTSDDDYDSIPFFISPLIHGQVPWQFNMASMGGGTATFVKEGIMYRLIECDSIEMFADRGLSLIVSSTNFYSIEAFDYDEQTGLVKPVQNFDGVNVMFELPLDISKADHEKAQEYLDGLWEENNERAANSPVPDGDIGKEFIIKDDGTVLKEVMTYESMKEWIDDRLEETQVLVDRGEYSESSMALDRRDYEGYLQNIKDGLTVTIYTYEDGARFIDVLDPNSEAAVDVDVSGEGVELLIGK